MHSDDLLLKDARKAQAAAAAVGVAALAAGVVGFTQSRELFWQGYLLGWVFCAAFTLGCFALMLLHNMIRGNWSLSILRIVEAGGGPGALLFTLALYAPVLLFGLHDLYPWAHIQGDHLIEAKRWWLNTPFFVARTVAYFLIWIAFAGALRRSSLEQDRTGDARLVDRRASIAAPGLVVFVITLTLAVTDWVMSLDPHWWSTIYGIWFLVCCGLSGMSLATLVVLLLSHRKPFSDIVTPGLSRDYGNVLLALTLFWAYISVSQFLIIYSGNLPEETRYFLRRMSGGWHAVGTFLVIFQFFGPFLLLLSGRTKRTYGYLIGVAVWMVFMRMVDMLWTIIPFFGPHELATRVSTPAQPLSWVHVAMMAGMGGIWLCFFFWQWLAAPVVPRHFAHVELGGVPEHA